MKKLTAILSFLFIAFAGYCSTPVTGGIYSNTTWTLAGSPYIVSDTIVIFSPYILTIEPGVVVQFDTNGLIEVRGRMIANGTPSDSIIFTSSSGTPMAGDYLGLSVASDSSSFTYCRFSYSTTGLDVGALNNPLSHCMFNYNIKGVLENSSLLVDTCTFIYNTIGINCYDKSAVEGSTFSYNGKAIQCGANTKVNNCTIIHNNKGVSLSSMCSMRYCVLSYNNYGVYSGGPSDTIMYNTIDYNTICGIDGLLGDSVFYNEIMYNGTGIKGGSENIVYYNNISKNDTGVVINGWYLCNSICDNVDYNAVAVGPGNISIPDNYWCLPDSAQIQATIYDGHQDINLGLVFFTPFYTTPCANVPSAINEVKTTTEEIEVYPNPNNGQFTIELNTTVERPLIEIYNVLGEKVLTEILPPSTRGQDDNLIGLTQQANGVYFYRVLNANGSLLGSGKLVVQR